MNFFVRVKILPSLLVNAKYPDFKHRECGDGLWLDSAPKWMFPGLGKLDSDVKVFKAKQVQDGKGDDSWWKIPINVGTIDQTRGILNNLTLSTRKQVKYYG
ncbi:unnamed protein product [Fraxinus pennsylvanica]|uniref:Uncharacterized protein n=1 Tax=Fraxinus pennsylvanica TaxID=56036 RepID=A0AAD2DN48_9LAMI|nr:unnamed protein product [Fraxinus pennsylvanica]